MARRSSASSISRASTASAAWAAPTWRIRLRNELTQKAIATECAQWIRDKATFKSFKGAAGLPPSLTVEMSPSAERTGADVASYIPFNGFTTVELGAARSADAYGVICRQDGTSSRMLLNTFEQAWNSDDLDDVTDAVVDNISQMYRENPPELVYYAALYRIFHEFLDDITADELPKEGTGFRESKIWNLLYDFQRDAVLAIINKLQTYDGCILADSVGLGKTFTALAVVKYYESLNRNVLVLCPKKLGDNWLTYRNNQRNNPIAADRLRYDVLYHTDLSRQRGTSVTGLDLETINWGAYDLVVIDESHNFRNGADSSRAARDGGEASENRYERLLNRVVKDGVPTKVLMLSATPVNNRFRDLRNQLALAYQGDPEQWSERLGLKSKRGGRVSPRAGRVHALVGAAGGGAYHRGAHALAGFRFLPDPRPGHGRALAPPHPALLRRRGHRPVPAAQQAGKPAPGPLHGGRPRHLRCDRRAPLRARAGHLRTHEVRAAQPQAQVRGRRRKDLGRGPRERRAASHGGESPQAPGEFGGVVPPYARARAVAYGTHARRDRSLPHERHIRPRRPAGGRQRLRL